MSDPPTFLRPTGKIAPRAVLPGDPAGAMAVAQVVIEGPLMTNHARGLWGYTGPGADGEPMTVQSTGIGAPSAAIVIAELARQGLRRAVRIGACATDERGPEPGTLLVVERAAALDGASGALGCAAGELLAPSQRLRAALVDELRDANAGPIEATIQTLDLHLSLSKGGGNPQIATADLATAAAFASGRAHGVEIAAALVVSRREGDGQLDDEALSGAAERLGRAAAAALGAGD